LITTTDLNFFPCVDKHLEQVTYLYLAFRYQMSVTMGHSSSSSIAGSRFPARLAASVSKQTRKQPETESDSESVKQTAWSNNICRS